MDFLFKHNQEKVDRKYNSKSSCDLKLFYDGVYINYNATFDFEYERYGSKKQIIFEHALCVDTTTGDITISYRLNNDNLTTEKMFGSRNKVKKNDFNMLNDLMVNGYTRGEKRIGYWGVKYERAIENISNTIYNILRTKFKSQFNKDKKYEGNLFELVVDFHLDKKDIKGHDGVYSLIQSEYPKKKWLLKNDNKFLPAVLDSYGIKSRYLVTLLNSPLGNRVKISSLNYICKLFGDNYVEYLKQILWEMHCNDTPPNRKTHELKNESEKNCMVETIKKWETDTLKNDSLIYSLNRLFSIRETLESKGMDLRFKCKNDNEFDNLMETWMDIKQHLTRGYKLRYELPNEFIETIEQDIIIGDEVFKPKVLLSEEQFRVEGFNMKNCMSKQFPHGSLYIFVAMQCKRKRINLQYRKGSLVQSYGKANTPVLDMFTEPTKILTTRFKNYTHLEWKKERYDFIND